jgi:ParB family transcriptional regulator, chromosome partitioning protein
MSNKRAALGRGLSALLPGSDDPSQGSQDAGPARFEDRVRLVGRVAEVEVASIQPNPYQPREHFDEAALDELAASIKQLGVIQPITVRVLGDGRYELISGERRLRAAKRARIARIPAYVREADTEEMLEMALVENVQREELNPVEIAIGYQRLIEECDLTQEHVAQKVGKSRASVANFLRLLRLPPKIQAALRDRSVTMGHARALINIDEEEIQDQILDEIIEKDLSVRQVEDRVRRLREREETPEEGRGAPFSREQLQVEEYTKRLRTHLSTKVKINHRGKDGGRIEIAYFSEDDLERLLDAITGR